MVRELWLSKTVSMWQCLQKAEEEKSGNPEFDTLNMMSLLEN